MSCTKRQVALHVSRTCKNIGGFFTRWLTCTGEKLSRRGASQTSPRQFQSSACRLRSAPSRRYRGRVQLGSVADIITALTAIGALFAAIVGAKHAGRLFAVEAKRDDDTAERERQTQASKVFAWVASRIGEGDVTYGVVVVNSSEQAIYDVEVRIAGSDGNERRPVSLTILPPGAYYLGESDAAYGWEFASRVESSADEIRPVTKSKKRGVVGMAFRDSSNLLWGRDGMGLLAPL